MLRRASTSPSSKSPKDAGEDAREANGSGELGLLDLLRKPPILAASLPSMQYGLNPPTRLETPLYLAVMTVGDGEEITSFARICC